MSIEISGGGVAGITIESDPTAVKLTGDTMSGVLHVPEIRNLLNTDLIIDSYNDTGAGTHYEHKFTPFDGKFLLATNGGGLVFPDGTTQTTATLTGPQGPQGQQGNNGADGGSFADVNYDGTPYIRINSSWQPLSSYDQSGIGDAPADSQAYVRYNNGWQLFSNYDQNSGGGGIGEAPYNGTAYIRINNDWQPLSSYDQTGGGSQGPQGDPGPQGPQGDTGPSGGSFADAPSDNTSYVRINNSWAQTFRELQGSGSGDPFYPFEVKITVNSTDYWMPVRPV